LLFISIHAQAGICTREYAPVCGQLPQHTQTFSNRCMLKDAGATWLSDGECPSSRVNAKAKNITLTVAGHDAGCGVRAVGARQTY
jgi:Kazal-type serine protease inhibitor domain